MKVFHCLEDFQEGYSEYCYRRPIVSVGSFDGLHLGHQYLLQELVGWAQEVETPSLVLTFHTHPRTFMTGQKILRIIPVEQKLALLKEQGVDIVLLIDFNAELKSTSAKEFCRQYLNQGLNAQGILLGHNNRIGQGREGTPEKMRQLGNRFDFEVRIAQGVKVGEHSISSSLIRDSIQNSDFTLTRKLLGRPYILEGKVQEGQKLGRTLGFPTMNLSLQGLVHPPYGVYGVRIRIRDQWYHGAANIGIRPTLNKQNQDPLLEVHVLNYKRENYGEQVEVLFDYPIRNEKKFPNLDALKNQLCLDVESVREKMDYSSLSEVKRLPLETL